jgi:radical SAM protein with 4Fe4S-binding SPASM domain
MNLLSYLKKRQNQFWRNYSYHHGWTKLRNLPEVFAIESTNYCNLRCVMCPRGEPDIMERSLGSMSDDLFAKILDDVDFYKEPCWFHWFGEPLMNPNLFHQIDMAKRRGVPDLGISTNATLLDAKNAQAILDSGLDTILIAVDGASKDVYEKVRLSPTFTFERVCENVRGFLDLKRSLGRTSPKATLSIIVMEETKSQLEDFRRTWLAAGADEILFKPFVTWGNQDTQFVEIASLESRTAHSQRMREHPCFALWESVVIAWDGRVVPCCYDFDASVTLGDLKKYSLREIWNSEAYVELRSKELRGCNDTSLCRNCNQAPGFTQNPLWPLPQMGSRKNATSQRRP